MPFAPTYIFAIIAAESDIGVALLVFLGVVVTAAGAAWAVQRTHSGKIADSEAAKLWDESTKMRHELREQVEALQAEIRQLKIDNQKAYDRIAELEAEIAALKRRIAELEARRG